MKNRYDKPKSRIGKSLSVFFVLLMLAFVITTSGCLDYNGNDEEMNADSQDIGKDTDVSSDEGDDAVEDTEQVYFSASDDTETKSGTEPPVEKIVVPMTTDDDRRGKKSSSSSTVSTSTSSVMVSVISVTGAGSATSVVVGQALQMNADVVPVDATDKNVTWSVINGTGYATINADGLLTAIEVGNVTVKATANDASGVSGALEIIIDPAPVTGISVEGEGNVASVVNGQTLQLNAVVTPSDATDSSIIWSVINGTGEATIDQTGLLTAIEAGNVTVTATANDTSGVFGTLEIVIEPILVTSISVEGGGCAQSVANGQTLQMYAIVTPSDATDSSVNWSVINEVGEATIDQTGLLTAYKEGYVLVKATANDASGAEDGLWILIYDNVT
ncbi:MAG: Ig-like domain-containing protein [Methanolobus sp.]|nr:Ig-like domain-containing protein [Methanolobus sp.]